MYFCCCQANVNLLYVFCQKFLVRPVVPRDWAIYCAIKCQKNYYQKTAINRTEFRYFNSKRMLKMNIVILYMLRCKYVFTFILLSSVNMALCSWFLTVNGIKQESCVLLAVDVVLFKFSLIRRTYVIFTTHVANFSGLVTFGVFLLHALFITFKFKLLLPRDCAINQLSEITLSNTNCHQ